MAWRNLASISVLCASLCACGDSDDGVERTASPSTADGSDRGDDGADADGSSSDGDDGAGEDGGVSDDGDDASDGDEGTAGDGSGNDDAARLRASCEDACMKHAECVGISESGCVDECAIRAKDLLAQGCVDEGVAETDCLGELTCQQLMAYGQEGRREHAQCGGAARDLFERCTVGGGTVPAPCTAVCERFQQCGATGQTVGACEEGCVLHVTSLDASHTMECSEGYLDLLTCVSTAACDQIEMFVTDGTTPSTCRNFDEALTDACE